MNTGFYIVISIIGLLVLAGIVCLIVFSIQKSRKEKYNRLSKEYINHPLVKKAVSCLIPEKITQGYEEQFLYFGWRIDPYTIVVYPARNYDYFKKKVVICDSVYSKEEKQEINLKEHGYQITKNKTKLNILNVAIRKRFNIMMKEKYPSLMPIKYMDGIYYDDYARIGESLKEHCSIGTTACLTVPGSGLKKL